MQRPIGSFENGRDTLRLLTGDRRQLVGKLDWVTKLWLLETFMQEERIGWDDPWLASLDLEYHNVNPERGLFLGIEAEGKAWRMTSEQDVETALVAGPQDTRAGFAASVSDGSRIRSSRCSGSGFSSAGGCFRRH